MKKHLTFWGAFIAMVSVFTGLAHLLFPEDPFQLIASIALGMAIINLLSSPER